MKKHTPILLTAFLMIAVTTSASAQQRQNDADKPAADQATRPAEAVTPANPVDVEVVISRYQGEKKLSSLPYMLSVGPTPNRAPVRLRMGGAVPMPTMAPPTGADGKPVGPVIGGGPVQYMDVGTNIDSGVRPLPDGRFEVFVSVEDKWVVNAAQSSGAGAATLPFVRSFQTSNTLVMRDGQTRQFTAAADRVTGEIVKVDVTLRVVK